MTSNSLDFIRPITSSEKRSSKPELSLYSVGPVIKKIDASSVLSNNIIRSIKEVNSARYADDGLYVSSKQPLNNKVVKPRSPSHRANMKESNRRHSIGKLLEVAIRDVIIHTQQNCQESSLDIISASIRFKDRTICTESYPFNKKLYKFLIRNSMDSTNFSTKIVAQDESSVHVPIPFPKHNVRNKKIEIDFAITDRSGQVHSGLIICTVSVVSEESNRSVPDSSVHHYTPSNDPNNPQRGLLSITRWKSDTDVLHPKRYFLLEDQAMTFPSTEIRRDKRKEAKKINARKDISSLLDIVVLEQNFSLTSLLPCLSYILSCSNQQPDRLATAPPNAGQNTKNKQTLTVTILRGIEVPVREESALVQPIVEVEWCNIIHSTSIADGPAPVWQQTIQFKVSRLTGEQYVKLRLFDQHPIWGLQWLGETIVPLESLNYGQEVERWIGLCPLRSPKHLFGYVQASPGYSFTRLYILMKMHQVGAASVANEGSVEGLSKAIQKCISVAYKIEDFEDPREIAKLVTLLSPLPSHYGPLKPRQALNLNKVDHYGRAALLTTLFQGLGLQSYVLLGTSQTSKLAAYCLTTDQSQNPCLWDPESGDYYNLTDSRCSLITVLRLIDAKTIWDNTQKSMAPSTLKYNPDSNRDWQPLSISSASSDSQSVQILHPNDNKINEAQQNIEVQEMEQNLKEYLIQWREALELSTTFNQHAETILRASITKNSSLSSTAQFDKKKLRQLYRVFYIHGFIINLRYTKLEEVLTLLSSTKSHMTTGPVEFALVCHIQTYIGKIRSIWLGLLILRNRE